MKTRILLAGVSLALFAAPALAFDTRSSTLPAFAQQPFAVQGEEALKGKFYSGIEPFRLSMHGDFVRAFGQGIGNAPGAVSYAGYYRAFKNKSFADIRVRSGFAPSVSLGNSAGGYDFTSVNLKAGYNLGRFQPFVMARFGAANSNGFRGAGFIPNDNAARYFFSGPQTSASFVQVGAGFNYAVTNNITLGVAVSAGAVSSSTALRP